MANLSALSTPAPQYDYYSTLSFREELHVFNSLKGNWCISRCGGDTASPEFGLGHQLFNEYVAKTLTDGPSAKILFIKILVQGKSYVGNHIS